MDEVQVERCDTCRFWESNDKDGGGACHRFPPVLSDYALKWNIKARLNYPEEEDKPRSEEEVLWSELRGPNPWAYPVSMLDGWCGEYQSAAEEEQP